MKKMVLLEDVLAVVTSEEDRQRLREMYEPQPIDIYTAAFRYHLHPGTLYCWTRRYREQLPVLDIQRVPNGRPRLLIDERDLKAFLATRLKTND